MEVLIVDHCTVWERGYEKHQECIRKCLGFCLNLSLQKSFKQNDLEVNEKLNLRSRLPQSFLYMWLKFIESIFLIHPVVVHTGILETPQQCKWEIRITCDKGRKQFDRDLIYAFTHWLSRCCPICFQGIIELSGLFALSLWHSYFHPIQHCDWIQYSGSIRSASEIHIYIYIHVCVCV